MAEVLGLVASGLSVAQIAGSIVTTSLKVKALLDEVKDAPENLRDMLGHIDLLTPILCEATTGDDEGPGTTSAPLPATSHPQPALQKALAACQAAGEQLRLLVDDLIYQIDVARGGVRRKRAMVKVVLKKGTLAQYEARLQKTIQLLNLAQNTYIIALQRTQPQAIVSQLISALSQRPQYVQSPAKILHDQSSPEIHTSSQIMERRVSTRQSASDLHECLQFGFAKVTGLVQIHTSSKCKDSQTITPAQSRVFQIQVQMPQWLCASVLNAVFCRSYAGWDCSFNMYGYLRNGSVEFDFATSAIYDDDVDEIHRLFQEGQCSPLDRLVYDNQNEASLLVLALHSGAWKVSDYLLNYGADQPAHVFPLGARALVSGGREPRLEALLKRDELNDIVLVSFLASSWKDLGSFTDLVDRLWPYNEFYTAGLEDQRFALATKVIGYIDDNKFHSPSPAIFQHLCGSFCLTETGSRTTTGVLSCITRALGHIVWYDTDVASKWNQAIWDVALQLNKALIMPEKQPLGNGGFQHEFAQLFPTSTPFTDMFLPSMYALPGQNSDPKCARQHKIGSRLGHCERAVQMWLNILQGIGIDILEYGRQEKERFKDQENGCEFRIFRDVWYDTRHPDTYNGLFEVRLISFRYGNQPGDWRLWWSEPTDFLVGDFWKEVEPEPLCIPGSWDEDF